MMDIDGHVKRLEDRVAELASGLHSDESLIVEIVLLANQPCYNIGEQAFARCVDVIIKHAGRPAYVNHTTQMIWQDLRLVRFTDGESRVPYVERRIFMDRIDFSVFAALVYGVRRIPITSFPSSTDVFGVIQEQRSVFHMKPSLGQTWQADVHKCTEVRWAWREQRSAFGTTPNFRISFCWQPDKCATITPAAKDVMRELAACHEPAQ